MDKNEIKKALYKQKPTANLQVIRNATLHYTSSVTIGEQYTPLRFEIPADEYKSGDFMAEMPTKLLIRWLQD